jgi:hypothetical protein
MVPRNGEVIGQPTLPDADGLGKVLSLFQLGVFEK